MPAEAFSKKPLYVQVRDLLAERVANGVWRPGSVLPNEQELARELEVSVGTVRKALDKMEEERVVARRQGRGTFVVDQATEAAASRFWNIFDLKGRPIPATLELVEQATGAATAEEQERLGLRQGEEVLRTLRRRLYNGRPFMLEEASVAITSLPGLKPGEAGNYQIAALAQAHGVHLAKAVERVTMTKAAGAIAEQLAVAPETAIMKLDRVILALDGSPVEWRVGYCHFSDDQCYAAETR